MASGTKNVILTPLDFIMPRFYTRMNLTFTKEKRDSVIAIKVLQQGFDALVQESPFLSGVLKPTSDDGKGRLEIDLSQAYPMQAKIDIVSPEALNKNIDAQTAIGVMAAKDGSLPVCAVQLNFLSETISASFCIHHAVSDAYGISAFVRRWAELSRRLLDGPTNISHDRTPILTAGRSDTSIPHPAYKIPSLPSPNDSSSPANQPDFSNLPKMTAQIFEFETEKLSQLKPDVQAELQSKNAWTSTNDVLCALVWHAVTRARLGDRYPIPTREVRLGMAVNGRSKMNPPIPDTYIGNVNIYATASISMDHLAELSTTNISATALVIRQGVLAVDDKYIRALIATVDEQKDATQVQPSFNSFLGQDLAISSWADLGFGNLEWGPEVGRVEKVRIPTIGGFDGLCIIMPKMEGKGIEVLIGLREDHMDDLKRDEEFARYAKLGEE